MCLATIVFASISTLTSRMTYFASWSDCTVGGAGAPARQQVASVKVVEFQLGAEAAMGQAAGGGSCRVSGAMGGASNSAMPSACM